MKKVIVVGASGMIGKAIVKKLEDKQVEIVRVGRSKGDVLCDYTNQESVDAMFEEVGEFSDLILVVGGDRVFKHHSELTSEDFLHGFNSKVIGGQRLVASSLNTIKEGGSIVLTSGMLSHVPNESSIAIGLVNGAVDTYVSQMATYLPKNIRLNSVSPTKVLDNDHGKRFGFITVDDLADYYLQAIFSDYTGKNIRAWGGYEAIH